MLVFLAKGEFFSMVGTLMRRGLASRVMPHWPSEAQAEDTDDSGIYFSDIIRKPKKGHYVIPALLYYGKISKKNHLFYIICIK